MIRGRSIIAAGWVILQTASAQSASLSGSVVDEFAAPISTRVDLIEHGSGKGLKTSNGPRFIFSGLDPGTYDLHVYRGFYSYDTVEDIHLMSWQQEDLPPLVLRFEGICPNFVPPERLYLTHAESGALEGHVANENGVALSNARVRLFRNHTALTRTTTDAGGQFVFRGLQEGTYFVLAELDGFYSEYVNDLRGRPGYGSRFPVGLEACTDKSCSPGLKTVRVVMCS